MMNFTMTLFLMSIKASVLIFVILLVKKIFNNFFNAKTHFLIWFLLFMVLTIPYSPQSSLSIYNIPKYFGYNISSSYLETKGTDVNTVSNELELNQSLLFDNDKAIKKEENSYKVEVNKQTNANIKDKSIIDKLAYLYKSKDFIKILSYIWLVGFVTLSGFVLIKNIKFYKTIRAVQTDLDKREQILLNDCKNYLGIKKGVELIKINSLFSPSLIGFYKPRIVLPKQIVHDFDNEKLRYIILHELAHLKRKDVLTNYFILMFQLVYWFNPIVWLGFNRMKVDMEIACDAFVLKHLKKEQHISYGKVILNLLEYFSTGSSMLVSTNILNYKSEVKRRIIMIKKFCKTSCALTLAGVMLIALVGCSSMSSAMADDKTSVASQHAIEEIAENNGNMISAADAEKIFENKNDIIGRDYEYIRQIIGTPYIKTYYVNKDEVLTEMSSEAIYPIKSQEESSALHIFFDKDKIADITIDEFSGMSSRAWKDTDYKVDSYSYEEGSDIDEKNMETLAKLKDQFLNKSLDEFKEKFNLVHGNIEAYTKDETMQLSVYSIVSKENPSPVEGLYILSENGTIKDIKIDTANIQLNLLDEYFSLSNK